jgi:hypothetical protein
MAPNNKKERNAAPTSPNPYADSDNAIKKPSVIVMTKVAKAPMLVLRI